MIPVSGTKTILSSQSLNQGVNDGLRKRLSTNRYGHGDTARAEEVGIWNENGKEPGSEKGKNNGLVGNKAGAAE